MFKILARASKVQISVGLFGQSFKSGIQLMCCYAECSMAEWLFVWLSFFSHPTLLLCLCASFASAEHKTLPLLRNLDLVGFLLNNTLGGAADLWLGAPSLVFQLLEKSQLSIWGLAALLFLGVTHWLSELCKSSDRLVNSANGKCLQQADLREPSLS